jgi:hypothetical protein
MESSPYRAKRYSGSMRRHSRRVRRPLLPRRQLLTRGAENSDRRRLRGPAKYQTLIWPEIRGPAQAHPSWAEASREDEYLNMNVRGQIKEYIASQTEPRRSDMQSLHRMMLKMAPACKLWFLDGKNSENKTVSNPNIGYGLHTINYADGKLREFYKIGISANTTGISVYIVGIKDKTYLVKTYGKEIGKASVTGYCIKFKTLKDIDIKTLGAAIRYGFEAQTEKGGRRK